MKKKSVIIISLFLLVLFFASPIGVTLTRYVTQNIKNYIMEANNFFFNSDKLVYGGTSYGINNWSGVSQIEIQIELNNHKNNILTSDADIEYTISTQCDTTSVSCVLTSNSGVIQRAEKTDNITLYVNPLRVFNDNESTVVTVTATSSSPYVKTLSATFTITVGTRGINYEITDSVGSAYLTFKITNAQDTYKVITAFGTHNVGDVLTNSEYEALSSVDKEKCASALINLTFNPSVIILDTTSDIMKNATFQTTYYDNIDYISSITFKVDVMSSMDIRFYKRDTTQNYTYPFGTNTPVVSFTAL